MNDHAYSLILSPCCNAPVKDTSGGSCEEDSTSTAVCTACKKGYYVETRERDGVLGIDMSICHPLDMSMPEPPEFGCTCGYGGWCDKCNAYG